MSCRNAKEREDLTREPKQIQNTPQHPDARYSFIPGIPADNGAIFVQISDENQHSARIAMDEV